jgi:hypothetical protein
MGANGGGYGDVASGSINRALGKTSKHGQWSLNKEEALSKPPVSESQRKAMWAAADGHSDLGIPSSVGKDFADSDKGGKLPMKKGDRTPEVSTANHTKDKKKDSKEQKESFVPKADNATNPKAKLHKSEYRDRAHFLEELAKAIKPGPTLDYGKMNPKKDYKEMEAKAPVIDYGGNRMSTPKPYAGAAEHAAATRAKLDAESKETAAETIARRQKANKSDNDHAYQEKGVNLEANPSEADKARMTAKNDMMGYGTSMVPMGGQKGAMMMSEKEPQPGEPGHEEDEKVKAKKIKNEAQDLLDMHKADKTKPQDVDTGKDDGLRTVKVKKDNEMAIKAVRAQPAC